MLTNIRYSWDKVVNLIGIIFEYIDALVIALHHHKAKLEESQIIMYETTMVHISN